MMNGKRRVAAYCRVSTDKEEQANSLRNQREFFEDYINKHDDWVLVDIYYDEGKSGTTTDHRDGFNSMIADCRQGLIDTVLTKEVSRFGRNVVDVLNHTRDLKAMDINVIFSSDGIDTATEEGELRLSIMASLAQDESRKTSQRVKFGHRCQMEKGVVFGRSLLGYDVKDGKLIINEEGADIVRSIFNKYTIEGKGTHVIARELYEEGIKPMRCREWNNVVILRALRNEKYVGDLCQGKTFTPDYKTHKKKYQKDTEKMVYIKNHHEPIISRELWEMTQAELKRRSPNEETKSRYSNRYWCSGKVYCGECGRRCVCRNKNQKNSKYRAWRCSESAKHGRKKAGLYGETIGCDNQSINERVLLAGVYFVLEHIRLNKDKLVSEMKSEISSIMKSSIDDNTDKLKAKIAKIEADKKILLQKNIDGVVSDADYIGQNRYYDEEILKLEQKIQAVKSRKSELEEQVRRINGYVDYIKKQLNFDSPNEQVCGEVVERITVYPEHQFEIKLKNVPMAVRLSYITTGRGENFTSDFEIISGI